MNKIILPKLNKIQKEALANIRKMLAYSSVPYGEYDDLIIAVSIIETEKTLSKLKPTTLKEKSLSGDTK